MLLPDTWQFNILMRKWFTCSFYSCYQNREHPGLFSDSISNRERQDKYTISLRKLQSNTLHQISTNIKTKLRNGDKDVYFSEKSK